MKVQNSAILCSVKFWCVMLKPAFLSYLMTNILQYKLTLKQWKGFIKRLESQIRPGTKIIQCVACKVWNQGLIEPPKAARGHATCTDGEIQHVKLT